MKVHFIQHVSFEHPGYLLQWAEKQQHSTSFTKIFEQASFPSVDEFDMLIVMGGPLSVNEENKYEWLKAEKQFIKASIEANKKILGICLGSQLIAEVLGGKVYTHTQKEIGWWPVKKVNEQKHHPFIMDMPGEFITFHWHGDTFQLPPGAQLLFSSEACTNQAYLYNNQVAGLQFHLEATPQLISNMLEHERGELIKAPYIQTETEIKQKAQQYCEVQQNYLTYFLTNFAA